MPVIARDTVASDHLVYAWPFPIGPEDYEVACAEDEQVVMCPAWTVAGLFGPGRHRWRTPDPMRPTAAYFVLTAPVEASFDLATIFQVPTTGETVRLRATGSVQVRCADPSLLIAQFVGLPFDAVNDGVLRSVSRSVERMLARLLTRRVVMTGTPAAVMDPDMLPQIVDELVAYNPAAGAVFGVDLVRMGHIAIHADDGTKPWDHVLANPDWATGRRRPIGPAGDTDRVAPPNSASAPTETIRVPRSPEDRTIPPTNAPIAPMAPMAPPPAAVAPSAPPSAASGEIVARPRPVPAVTVERDSSPVVSIGNPQRTASGEIGGGASKAATATTSPQLAPVAVQSSPSIAVAPDAQSKPVAATPSIVVAASAAAAATPSANANAPQKPVAATSMGMSPLASSLPPAVAKADPSPGALGGVPIPGRSPTLPQLPPPPAKPVTPRMVPVATPLPSVRRAKTVEVPSTPEETTQPNANAPSPSSPSQPPPMPAAAAQAAAPVAPAKAAAPAPAAPPSLKSTRIGHAVEPERPAPSEPRGAILGIGMAHIGSSQVASGEIPQKVSPGSRVLVPGPDGLMQSATVRQLLQGYYELEVGGSGETIWVPVSGVVPET